MATFFEEIKEYVGFGDADTEALRAFAPHVAPHLDRIVDHFYACILEHPGAHRAITEGEAQVARLKKTLVSWLESGLSGPHDEAFYERRARIGRVHVRIALPQRYMFTAMNVIRVDLRGIIEQVYADRPDERRRVGDAVDRLLDLELAIMLHTYQEDSDERLRRHTRLSAVGQLAASIAHELRNPLGVIESSLYLLRRRASHDPAVARHLDRIGGQVRTSAGIITDLLEMTRDRPPASEPTLVGRVVDEALELLRVPDTVSLNRDIDPDAVVLGEPRLLVRAMVNLLQNAVAALESERGCITVRATAPEGGLVALSVADDGPGFPPEVLGRAFEPLVTGRATGIGLGLALVRRICERHGGSVEAANGPDGGAVVTLRLPAGAGRTTEG